MLHHGKKWLNIIWSLKSKSLLVIQSNILWCYIRSSRGIETRTYSYLYSCCCCCCCCCCYCCWAFVASHECTAARFGRSNFSLLDAPAPTDAFRTLAAEVGTMSGNKLINFAEMPTSTVHLGIFYMPQICDMGPTPLLPFRRKACLRIFPLLKTRELGYQRPAR
jgi:hypothetical protein